MKGSDRMTEALLFLLGFASVTTVYEVAKTGKTKRAEKELLKVAKDEMKRKKR